MQKGKQNFAAGSATGAAPALDHGAIAQDPGKAASPSLFCKELATQFRVRPGEIALLRLEKDLLKFIFPEHLKTAGAIPVSSSSAVAAHTAMTKKVELFNNFVKVRQGLRFELGRAGFYSGRSAATGSRRRKSLQNAVYQRRLEGFIKSVPGFQALPDPAILSRQA
jgi:hypothetical protein